jgi:hypothetical protein
MIVISQMLRSSLLCSLMFLFREPFLLLPDESLGLYSFSEDELVFLDPVVVEEPVGDRGWETLREPSLGTTRDVGG